MLHQLSELVRSVAGFEFERFAPGGSLAEPHRASVILAAAAELAGDVTPPYELTAGWAEEYATLQLLYEALLESRGLQVRPPLTVEHLTAMLSAMTEGFALEVWYSGAVLRDPVVWAEDGREAECTPFAIAVLAVAEKLTEPKTCTAPGCHLANCVLVGLAPDEGAVALCDRHLWSTLTTHDGDVSPIVVHRGPTTSQR